MNLRRMRYLMNRLPMARHRAETANPDLREFARDQYKAIRDELAALQQEAKLLIDALDDPLEQTVMRMRYIDGLNVRRIAEQLHYSEGHIFRVLKTIAAEIDRS